MDVSNINVWAVLVAALSTFVVGWLWYGPLFGKAWMSASGMTEEKAQQGNMGKIFGLAFVFELIMAFNLAMFFYGSLESAGMMNGWYGGFYGFLTGFGWLFFATGVTGLFEQRSWKYVLVNGGYWTVTFTIMGWILGVWK